MIELIPSEEIKKLIDPFIKDLTEKLDKNLPYAQVEHIGSSSIPKALTKGDLDLYVEVEPEQMNESLKKVLELGFTIKENTLRTESLVMLTTDKYNYDVAIQLVAKGSKFEDFIRFRDLLRADESLVEEYNRIKTEAQNLSDDEYRSYKSKFIEKVLKLDS